MSALSKAQQPEPVCEFIKAIRDAEDEDERDVAKREIGGLIRYTQRFYRDFLLEGFALQITGFLYRDKRQVARILVKREGEEGTDLEILSVELCEVFEDLVDVLQGDVDFGYSGDIEDFGSFHSDAYPTWLEAVDNWAVSLEEALAETRQGPTGFKGKPYEKRQSLIEIAKEYRDVTES